MAGRGDRLPVSALPNDGTFPTGTTQWEKRNLADRSSGLGSGSLHPVRQMRAGLPARGDSQQSLRPGGPRRRARDLQIARRATAGVERTEIHPAGRGGRLHRLRHLRGCLPGAQQIRGAAEGDQHAAAVAAARKRARELEFLPLDSGAGSRAACRLRQRARDAGAAAALRVLRRLRRLRRDALHQTAHPALRRSAAHRERHRLLLDLRRQSADHSLHEESRMAADRPGRIRSSKTMRSSVSASAFRSTSSRSSPANCSIASHRRSADMLATEILNARQRDEADIFDQRARVAELKRKLAVAERSRRAGDCSRWPTRSCAKASGSSAATAGVTTSVTADSITSWPADAT